LLQASSAVQARAECSPPFMNKVYDLATTPLIVSEQGQLSVRRDAEAYVALLETIGTAYQRRPEVRRYYGLRGACERLACADSGLQRHTRICRLDGYVRADDGRLVFLENNADAPAGTLFTPRLEAFLSDLWGSELETQGLTPSHPTSNAFLTQLLNAYAAWGGKLERPRLVVLQPRGNANLESSELIRVLQTEGFDAGVADPRELDLSGAQVKADGRNVDLIWNKVNTADWERAFADDDSLAAWQRAIADRRVCHLNGFLARYVLESKLSLALVHEPEFSDCFSAAELELARRVLPWATKLEPGKRVEFWDRRLSIENLLEEFQAQLVIKVPYDIRGDGVTIGRAVDRTTWRSAASAAFRGGGIAQEFIEPARYPVVFASQERQVRVLKFSLDSFVFGGKVVGFGSKASAADKVNVFQGGSKLGVMLHAARKPSSR